MTTDIGTILLLASGLILLSILLAKIMDNLGLPTIVLFLGVGMLAGAEGPGGIRFNDPHVAQLVGITALVLILFGGGLETRWDTVRSVLWQAVSLSTVGVLVTTGLIAIFITVVSGISFIEALLIGAVISSTDAAAVFSVLRGSGTRLKDSVRYLLEAESGSNDPMAILLTLGLIQKIVYPETGVVSFVVLAIRQMLIGGLLGYWLGRGLITTVNNLRLRHEGIYPVFVLAYVGLSYGVTAYLGGSGFLAVYLVGLLAGNADFVRKRTVIRFFDGIAWLSQIAMFITLGLMVVPSRLIPLIGVGLLTSLFLMIVARPVSVFAGLIGFRLSAKEKLFVSWVGLRGAVPIVLATFPMLAGLPNAQMIFDLVFFIVLTSALMQGWSVPAAARLCGVAVPHPLLPRAPIEFDPGSSLNADLVDLALPAGSAAEGKPLVELGLPGETLVVLIGRNDQYFVPSGETTFEAGDTLLLLVQPEKIGAVRAILSQKRADG